MKRRRLRLFYKTVEVSRKRRERLALLVQTKESR